MSADVRVFVEGKADAFWTETLLRRAFPELKHVDVVPCGGKTSAIKQFVKNIASDKFRPVLLVDADTPYIKNAREEVLEWIDKFELAKTVNREFLSERIFFAIPTFEAWFFSDTAVIKEAAIRPGNLNLDRIYFPDEIPEPKQLARQLFGPGHGFQDFGRAIVERINLGVAVTRSPSLRDFLRGVGKIVGSDRFDALPDANRALGKRLLVSLLRETNQSETVIYRTLSGQRLTVDELITAIQDESEIASEYASDLLRVARDQLAREAKRKD